MKAGLPLPLGDRLWYNVFYQLLRNYVRWPEPKSSGGIMFLGKRFSLSWIREAFKASLSQVLYLLLRSNVRRPALTLRKLFWETWFDCLMLTSKYQAHSLAGLSNLSKIKWTSCRVTSPIVTTQNLTGCFSVRPVQASDYQIGGLNRTDF